MSVSSSDLDQKVVASVAKRYFDAYIVARTINAFGQTVKIGGMVLGSIVLFGSLVVGSRGGAGSFLGFAGFIIALVITAVFFLLGTLTSAQGQILMATLDTAVNSSPLLSNPERVQLMSASSSDAPAQGAYSRAVASTPRTGPWRCGCGQQNPGGDACLECGVARELSAV
jgi:hypothetical protein